MSSHTSISNEDIFELLQEGLAGVQKGLARLEKKVDERFNKVDERFNKVDERFNKVDERFNKLESKVDKVILTTCPQFMDELPSAIFTKSELTTNNHSGASEGNWTIVEFNNDFYAMSCLQCCCLEGVLIHPTQQQPQQQQQQQQQCHTCQTQILTLPSLIVNMIQKNDQKAKILVTSDSLNFTENAKEKDDFILIMLDRQQTVNYLNNNQKRSIKLADTPSVNIDKLQGLGNINARKLPLLVETAFGPRSAFNLEFYSDGGFATISSNFLMNGDSGAHVLVPTLPDNNVEPTEMDAWGTSGEHAKCIDGVPLRSLGIYHGKSLFGQYKRQLHIVTFIPPLNSLKELKPQILEQGNKLQLENLVYFLQAFS